MHPFGHSTNRLGQARPHYCERKVVQLPHHIETDIGQQLYCRACAARPQTAVSSAP